jgi:hypothetical protein
MRRILVKYAKPGMVLAKDLHDGSGQVAIGKGTQLTDRWVQALAYVGASELVILDERFQDVSVSSMISPELEGTVSEALREALARIAAAVSGSAAACRRSTRPGAIAPTGLPDGATVVPGTQRRSHDHRVALLERRSSYSPNEDRQPVSVVGQRGRDERIRIS